MCSRLGGERVLFSIHYVIRGELSSAASERWKTDASNDEPFVDISSVWDTLSWLVSDQLRNEISLYCRGGL